MIRYILRGGLFFFQSKIIRVLNLWQKNGVFDMGIIQPLMDMANGAIVGLPAPALEGRETNTDLSEQCLQQCTLVLIGS